MNSVAHIFCAGSGLLVPARDPYERELLVEPALDRARRMGAVRVVVHGRAWNVTLRSAGAIRECVRCSRVLATWCAAAAGGDPYCLRCAFGADTTAVPNPPELRNQIKSRQAPALAGGSVLAAVFQRVGVPFGRTAA